MIPIKLTIEGLYSYRERQTIDFEELTSAGLFGIVGGVGSGKSSILEAITYALYGETERLNSRDRRAYNMMNLKSDRSFIEFDFENHEKRIFRCKREMRRNSRNFDDVKPSNTVFYEFKNEQWIPLEDSDAAKIIGLSYTNFKRTIIIPQGQFKEFLELGGKDRTTMMKEIFQLHRFDFFDKVSRLRTTNTSNLDNLDGRLQAYDSVTQEDIANKTEVLKQEEEKKIKLSNEFELINQKYQLLKSLKSDYEVLRSKNEEFERYKQRLPEIKKRESEAEQYDRLFKLFSQDLSKLKELKQELSDNGLEQENLSKKLLYLKSSLEEKRKSIDSIASYHKQLPQKRNEESDLQLVVKVIEASAKIAANADRYKKGEGFVNETDKVVKTLGATVNSIRNETDNLRKQLIDPQILMAVSDWFLKSKTMSEAIEEKDKLLANINADLKQLRITLEEKNINVDFFETNYQKQVEELNLRQFNLENKRNELMTQQKLVEYSNELHDGRACPLCGSTEHPHILHANDVTEELNKAVKALNNIASEREKLQNDRLEAIRLLDQLESKKKELENASEQLRTLNENYQNHLLQFVWSDFDATNEKAFIEQKNRVFALQKEIDKKELSLKEKQNEQEQARSNLERYRKKLEELTLEENSLKASIETNKSNLKVVDFAAYKEKQPDDVNRELSKLKQENDRVEENYKKLTDEINLLTTDQASASALKESLDKKQASLKNDIEKLNKALHTKLLREKTEDLKHVETVLSSVLDVAKEREEINAFNLQFGILENKIKDLRKRLDEASYDDSKFTEEENFWNTTKEQLEQLKVINTKLAAELERVKKQYEEKKELLKEKENLEKRKANVQIMYNLFKGAGFVEYISSIYLSQLCDHANVRFHRMTRNQLRLRLNENNDFEIIDYLNEGRSRSVKTLSGGQAFQVSLSLALALAESVQTNAQADRNFFFIDEGFGTQDLESVNIVFETLTGLNKENKIVGIISHVEELKERIPMTLTITKDEERGSLIEVNR